MKKRMKRTLALLLTVCLLAACLPLSASAVNVSGVGYKEASASGPEVLWLDDSIGCTWVKEFSNGIAMFEKGDSWGFIDTTGKVVVAPRFGDSVVLNLHRMTGPYYYAYPTDSEGTKYGFFDEAGALVSLPDYWITWAFSEGLYLVQPEQIAKLGYVDSNGKIVIPIEYDEAYPFTDGLALVGKVDEDMAWHYGYINTKNQLIVPLEYDWASPFYCGVAFVQKGEDLYLINRAGKVISTIDCDYYYYDFSQDRDWILKDDQWQCIDVTGNTLFELSSGIRPFGYFEDRALVTENGKYGYIDLNGDLAIQFLYEEAGNFSEGLAWVKKIGTEKWGCIDKAGNTVVPFEYDYGVNFSEGVAPVKKDGKWGIMKNPLSDGSSETETPVFTDVPANAYYAEAVKWAVENNITSGTGGGKFSPTKSCSRAEAVTFLWRAAGCPEPTSSAVSFSDVKSNTYYTKAVAWAVEKNITSGTGGGKFSPDKPCSRSEIVAFLYRAEGSPAVSGGAAFSDVPEKSFYTDAVAWAVEQGITSGTGGGKFSPVSRCDRSQIVSFLYRYST